MKGTIRFVFEGEEKELAAGLTIRHLLTPEQIRAVRRRKLAVVDGRGQERGLGGALTDGARLALKKLPTP